MNSPGLFEASPSTSALALPDASFDAARVPVDQRVQLGSDAHKVLFCGMLLTSFDPYRPAVIDWPKLGDDARTRLMQLPIWDIAVQTEGRARLDVASYAELVRDPLLKRAIQLDAFEEGRHKHVLSNLVRAYGITLAPEPEYQWPRDPEWAFLRTGYSECIDSFFAFGLFEAAKRSGYFPMHLVQTFEPVIQEEARHILFFVNWSAWHRRNLPWWGRIRFLIKILAVWSFLIWERIGIARDIGHGKQDNNFTIAGSKDFDVDLGVFDLVNICLAENDRRLGQYDHRLLKPRVIPTLARAFMRIFARRQAQTH